MNTITISLISILISLASSASIATNYKLACRDETGNPVDWFTIYKLPSLAKNVFSKWIPEGSGYAFMTEKNQTWSLSSQSIANLTSMPALTLDILYKSTFDNNNNMGYILYNDQFNNKSDLDFGHAKGIVLFDDKSIVWIVHSIPEYPPMQAKGHYGIGSSQLFYGQSMVCLSLNISALEQIGKQLLLTYPQIYDSFIPDSLKTLSPSFTLVYNRKRNALSPFSNVEVLKTLGNNEFVAMHKSTYFANDLYSELVAKYSKSNLFVETWSRGNGTMQSDCASSYPVHNVDVINFKSYTASFKITSDHSKWAISTADTSDKYLCIGDINRQWSQFKRGGGTVCFKNNLKVWQSYYNIIDLVEPCSNESQIIL